MKTPWTSITLAADADPSATVYGFVLDHVWAVNGSEGQIGRNVARRPHWPEGMFIHVLPCRDLDPPTELSEGATHWIFFDDGTEYGAPEGDLAAADWLIGVLDDEVDEDD